MFVPPAVSPARQTVAAPSVSPAGALKAPVPSSVSAAWLWPALSAATNPPSLAQVLAVWSFTCETDSLHPSTGATAPSGVRHEYTWYCPAHACCPSAAPKITQLRKKTVTTLVKLPTPLFIRDPFVVRDTACTPMSV